MLQIIKVLRKKHHLLFGARDDQGLIEARAKLISMGVKIFFPVTVDTLENQLRSFFPDVVVLSRPNVVYELAALVRRVAPKAPIIYDTVDVHHLRLRRAGDDAARGMRELERQAGEKSDQVWAISPEDAAVFKKLCPDRSIGVVSSAHTLTDSPSGPDGRQGLIFIGNFAHPGNVAGLTWFFEKIWPQLIILAPATTLTIVGEGFPKTMHRFLGVEVRSRGYVENLEQLLAGVRVAIAPLTFGSGIKGKVLDPMAAGVPVVGTSIAVEGMGRDIIQAVTVADGPEEFAKACVKLMQDEDIWSKCCFAGQRIVAQKSSLKNLSRQLETALQKWQDAKPQ